MTEETATVEAPEEVAGDAVEVAEAELPEVVDTGVKSGAPGQIDILLDSTVSVSAGLGETSLQIRDVLQLGSGSVVKLDRRVGEAIDLYLCGTRFATGQLVVVDDHLAVRIKEILDPQATQHQAEV